MRWLLALFLIFSIVGTAEEKRAEGKADTRGPLLVELREGRTTFVEATAGAKLLPNRIYAVYFADLRQRVFVLTNAQGVFPSPREVFLTNSTVRPRYLGATGEPLFKLNREQRWEVTTETEERHRLEVTRADGTVFNRHRTADPGDDH